MVLWKVAEWVWCGLLRVGGSNVPLCGRDFLCYHWIDRCRARRRDVLQLSGLSFIRL